MKTKGRLDIPQFWIRWQECLLGNDPNSIFEQLSIMIWDAALFRLILESRRMQSQRYSYIPELNIRLHMFIDWNFFQAQVVAIRRLVDNYGLDGPRGVYSLKGLIEDIQAYRDGLTRQKFLEQQGFRPTLNLASDKTDDCIWIDISEADQLFDRLSGCTPGNRSPDDLITAAVFENLLRKLKVCREITKYVDKHIAHAATPESRRDENADAIRITFGKIWQAHKLLYQVAEFLSENLFSQDRSILPVTVPGMFLDGDVPFLDLEPISKLEQVWAAYYQETKSWRAFDSDWLNSD